MVLGVSVMGTLVGVMPSVLATEVPAEPVMCVTVPVGAASIDVNGAELVLTWNEDGFSYVAHDGDPDHFRLHVRGDGRPEAIWGTSGTWTGGTPVAMKACHCPADVSAAAPSTTIVQPKVTTTTAPDSTLSTITDVTTTTAGPVEVSTTTGPEQIMTVSSEATTTTVVDEDTTTTTDVEVLASTSGPTPLQELPFTGVSTDVLARIALTLLVGGTVLMSMPRFRSPRTR